MSARRRGRRQRVVATLWGARRSMAQGVEGKIARYLHRAPMDASSSAAPEEDDNLHFLHGPAAHRPHPMRALLLRAVHDHDHEARAAQLAVPDVPQ